ncbi:MAG TPA: copper chaperone PCu(A)C [Xanthobacteraceae bacterium]
MRSLFKFALFAALLAIVPVVFAQGNQTSTIAVEQPWARATPAGALTGIVYMTLENKTSTADRLTSVSSNVAAQVQIHEMAVVDGIMQMRQVAGGLPIPADGSVILKPGSYHVMLIGLRRPLVAGETFPLTLTFANAGNISITVPVQAMGAMRGNTGDTSHNGGSGDNKSQGGMGTMEAK